MHASRVTRVRYLLASALVALPMVGCMASVPQADAQKKHVESSSVHAAEWLPVTTFWESNQCNIREEGQRVLQTQADWGALIKARNNLVLGGSKANQPVPDFANNTYILVSLGDKSNPGYGLVLNAPKARYSHGKLELPVSVRTPEKGRVYPTLMVSPCMVLSVPGKPAISLITLE
ncbi:Hypothetical protein HDN1F_24290 [gamma proteobacterium HdN1]|nr:Hypothetical protein HDN1F_24290 [gamma proteobacterium HdN1]